MTIDTHNGWFKGLGDLVCFAWIGANLRAADRDVEFYAVGWRSDVLRFFQQRVTTELHGAIAPQIGYETAMSEGSPLSYLEWIAQQVGTSLRDVRDPDALARPRLLPPFVPDSACSEVRRYQRPKLDLPPMDRELGRAASARVLVFPEGAWPARTWPRNYWLELCHLLKAVGIDLAVVTEKRAEDFGGFGCIYNQSLAFIAAAMQQAHLVIGNDSGPAHLAGTIGTKTLAIHGPTTERIYAHIPEVVSFRKRSLDCAGCHGLPPFRESCALGCHELYRTFPEDVFARAMELLGEKVPVAAAGRLCKTPNPKLRKGGKR